MIDMINPDHYKGGRKYEPIEVIEDWGLNYRLGNALKYISRNGRKPGEDEREGLKKAIWYLEREIQAQTAAQPYPVADFDELYEIKIDNVPFDATGSIDLWDDSLGPMEPVDGEGNPVYAGDYKGPLYAPHPDLSGGYQGKRDLEQFEEDEIIRIFERRGTIIGVKKDGSTCELGGDGKCL